MPSLFDDHMVLQRDQPLAFWGKADPGEKVTVELAGHAATTTTAEDGHWQATLPPLPAGGPHTLRIRGENELVFRNVAVGEVWLASGQSNMQWTIDRSLNADLAKITVLRDPDIRYLPVKNQGSQEPQWETVGQWSIASPEAIGNYSAVAYAFAESLHAALGVTVGIIENAWGGSAAEAWVPRPVIINDPVLVSIHETWVEKETGYSFEEELAAFERELEAWKALRDEAERTGEEIPARPRAPHDEMICQHRPANLWNARILPIAPYSIRGVIWYQGEANASRGEEYKTLFPTLIREWRQAWNSDFPFYFVQLADFREEKWFSTGDTWPYLREAQTYTLHNVPNTGQAVIIDIGEGKDIHPRQKEEVGRRLVRWALARDYGFADLAFRSPEYASHQQEGSKLLVKFNYTGSGLRALDTALVKGFVIRDTEGVWHETMGRVISETEVELELPAETTVTALRYAWADNPICNLFSYEGLPATPFRTDAD